MKVAFFTHHFLESTHYAIAQIVQGLDDYRYVVYSKRFSDIDSYDLPNVIDRIVYVKGDIPELTSKGFDLVHALYDGKTAIRAAEQSKRHKLPFLLSFHGGYDTQAKIFDARYKEPSLSTTNYAEAITVVSNSDVARLRSIGVKKQIEVIPVPIDFRLIPKPVPRSKFKLLFVGRLTEKKGCDTAIRALALMPQEFSLTIVGIGPLQSELKELTYSMGVASRTHWLGELPLTETLRTINSSGILLHPARVAADGNAEGTPQTILWAQAMGVPVISTLTGSIQDIIQHHLTGVLINANDPFLLSDAVFQLSAFSKFYSSISVNAGRSVKKSHDLATVLLAWKRLYCRLTRVRDIGDVS